MSAKNTVEFVLKLRDQLGNVAKKAEKQISGLVDAQDKASKSGKKLSKTNTEISKSVKGMKGSMKGLVASVAASVAAFASMSVISERSKEITQLARDADKLKISIEELSSAQYAAFMGAGLGAENLVDGIQDLNEKISDFTGAGAGEAVDLFTTLGLDADIYNKKNALEQLLSVAESFKGLNNADQLRFLDQLGSDNLRDLAPILRDGGKEFKEMQQYAKDTGIAINSIDAKAIRRMNDEMAKTGKLTGALGNKFLAGISPVINDIAKSMNGLLESSARSSKGAADNLGLFTKAFAGLTAAAGYGLQKVINSFKKVDLASKELVVGIHDFVLNIYDQIRFIGNEFKKDYLSNVASVLSVMGKVSDTAADAADRVKKSIADMTNPKTTKESPAITALKGNIASVRAEIDATERSFSDLFEGKLAGYASDLKVNAEVDVKSKEDLDIEKAIESQTLKDEQKKVLDIKAENAAKAAQFELEQQKSALKQVFDLKNSELANQAIKEKKTVAEIARAKLDIEKKYNSDLAKLQKSESQVDIDKLQSQRSSLVSKSAKANSISKKKLEGEIAKIDGEIAALQREQQNIIQLAEYANQLLDKQESSLTYTISAEATASQIDELEGKLTEIRDKFSDGVITFDQAQDQSNPLIDQLNAVLAKSGDTDKIKEVSNLILKVKNEFSELHTAGTIVGESIGNNFINSFDEMITGTKSVKDAFKDMARDILSQLAKVYAQQMLVAALGGSAGGGGFGGGLASGILSSVGVFHGGTSNAGSDVTYSRMVNPNIFADAIKYHIGGIAGKQPGLGTDEVPAILKKDEMVLTEGQQKAVGAAMNNNGSSNVTVINKFDDDHITTAMESDAGEDAIMNVVRRHKDELSSY